MNPLLLVDSYKVHHTKMYPEGMSLLYSNFTPRKSRLEGVESVVVFGLQHFIKKYLQEEFDVNFFQKDAQIDIDLMLANDFSTEEEAIEDKDNLKREMLSEYSRHNPVDTSHIEALWDLGYLPIEIKALDEGTLCPIGVPMMTITNTHPDFAWLVNYLETLISCQLWQPITSATLSYDFKKVLNKYALETTGTTEGVQWQGHDFSMRGMSSVESAILSGMAHLTSFTGTDVIPAIYQLEKSYNATGLIGASVPATEHSVMCMGQKESEIETFKRLLNLYPTGILSVVSDTWDLWKVLTEYLPALKEEILDRNGKLVIRPDSGDPVDIICGTLYPHVHQVDNDPDAGPKWDSLEQSKGVIELLWNVFGGTVNEQGYKVLDSHIGAIYGDSITKERAIEICERLKAKGFASTNVVFGVGSYTYQYNTRDTFGFAMKATYGEVLEDIMPSGQKSIGREIFKDPITDDGTKKSKKGLLCVDRQLPTNPFSGELGKIVCYDQCPYTGDQSIASEDKGLLTTIFKDGKLVKETTLEEIRNKLK